MMEDKINAHIKYDFTPEILHCLEVASVPNHVA